MWFWRRQHRRFRWAFRKSIGAHRWTVIPTSAVRSPCRIRSLSVIHVWRRGRNQRHICRNAESPSPVTVRSSFTNPGEKRDLFYRRIVVFQHLFRAFDSCHPPRRLYPEIGFCELVAAALLPVGHHNPEIAAPRPGRANGGMVTFRNYHEVSRRNGMNRFDNAGRS
jgi:hypothetical protein